MAAPERRDGAKQGRAVLVAAAAVALVALSCIVAWQGSQPASLAEAKVSSGEAKMKPAAGTLALFDTSGKDHDGEPEKDWKPKPKLTPGQQKENLLSEEKKSLLNAEEKLGDKSLAESARKDADLNVRNVPEIQEQEKSLEDGDARKAGALLQSHASREEAYSQLKDSEQSQDAKFREQVMAIKKHRDEYRASLKRLRESGGQDSGASDRTAEGRSSQDYNDWYDNLYAKALKKEFQRKKAFVDAVTKDKSPYDAMFSEALKLDEERQMESKVKMSEIRGKLQEGRQDREQQRKEWEAKQLQAQKKDQALLNKEVEDITGGLGQSSKKEEEASAAKKDKIEKEKVLKEREAAAAKEKAAVVKEEEREEKMAQEKAEMSRERKLVRKEIAKEDAKEAAKEGREKEAKEAMRVREEKEIRKEEHDEEKSEGAMKHALKFKAAEPPQGAAPSHAAEPSQAAAPSTLTLSKGKGHDEAA
eukprot:CAMPEP_0206232214 /NCGR_PEP_ID=MMETSP0047_2-20121206/11292_1 /ASSEMBLY_ACC=CAM_ASM_000192 /TAXON_ID=195065 /ORGANISM="Chroomonas mesostigmatica_cf, Strain CCMP1168" /LENGTH=474 /DNA_ID=CAMNT_0053655927 /DNA_START=22 /DNA_END=1443 /DNA_ORIENTATION=-